MKNKRMIIAVAVVLMMMAAIPSVAQVKFGVKGGLNVTKMSVSSEVYSADNNNGFFIGPTVKFTLPIVGLGIDAAALYDERKGALVRFDNKSEDVKFKSINVPVNLRWNIGLGSLAGIYLAAGPQFGFALGDFGDAWDSSFYKKENMNVSINLGAGLSLLKHLELGFTYNIQTKDSYAITEDWAGGNLGRQVTDIKTNAWQISAAYYF
ncbi:MAG: porin family protein [Prevotellaceae bacterium]|nr:porin family protein [Prevotellaceae bacterium]